MVYFIPTKPLEISLLLSVATVEVAMNMVKVTLYLLSGLVTKYFCFQPHVQSLMRTLYYLIIYLTLKRSIRYYYYYYSCYYLQIYVVVV